MCEADIGKQNGHNTLYNAKQSKVDRCFTGGNIFLLFSDSTVLVINPRTYMQIHTPTVVQGGVDGPPPRLFDMLQYFKTILPSRDAITVMRMRAVCLFRINLLGQH